MPPLNVPLMLEPILGNYDAHIRNFIHFLDTRVDCMLIYDGPLDIHQHIRERTLYALSVQHRPTKKILRKVYPIMLGSQIDLAIHHLQCVPLKRIFLPFLMYLFKKWILVVVSLSFVAFCAICPIFLSMIQLTRIWNRKKWFVCLPTILWIGVKS
ncbi:RNA_pol_Rpb2_6 domain-containing protein [Trichonephila clavata]|uniref:RNA_pol_Rpb2_6 domain-containing protein n=1 Tax=Trichonephila clavata TaxID=2740835 RepID=A0A8X6KEN5_TRICU|nr:RNA_pol_Rpb2_6 domain-containing protein [Trichonephila clavata]